MATANDTTTARSHIVTLFGMTLNQAHELVADVPDDRFAEMPYAEAKHPGWVLGHLAIASGMMAGFLSEDTNEHGGICGVPDAWARTCAPGSEVTSERPDYGEKDALLAELTRVHGVVVERYEGASDAALAAEFPNPEYRSFFPTVGDAATYLMAYHEGYHLGQLSQWCQVVRS